MERGTQWPSRTVTEVACTPNGLAENDEYRELSWTAHNAVPGVLVVGGADDLTAGTQRQFAREAGEFGLESTWSRSQTSTIGTRMAGDACTRAVGALAGLKAQVSPPSSVSRTCLPPHEQPNHRHGNPPWMEVRTLLDLSGNIPHAEPPPALRGGLDLAP